MSCPCGIEVADCPRINRLRAGIEALVKKEQGTIDLLKPQLGLSHREVEANISLRAHKLDLMLFPEV